MQVIGLTGGIGSGKSSAADLLGSFGAIVIDADAEGHKAYARGTLGWRRVVELFSENVLHPDGEVDRNKLGKLVFSDPRALAWLNSAIHPLIRDRIVTQLEELSSHGTNVTVIEAALLRQAGWDDLVDEIWVMKAPSQLVIDRLSADRGLERWEIRRRIDAQEAKTVESDADVLIDNNGSLEDLRSKLEMVWRERILN